MGLKNASAKAVIEQLGGNSCSAEKFDDIETLDEQLFVLNYLQEKFLKRSSQ